MPPELVFCCSRAGTAYCMQKQYIIALDVTEERQRGEMPSWQSKCENRILVFVWVSVGFRF